MVLYIYSFSCINIQYGEWIVKPIKLQSESMGFRLRNQGFQDAKPRVLGGETHAFANEKYQLWKMKVFTMLLITIYYHFNKRFINICKHLFSSSSLPFCIFMQFYVSLASPSINNLPHQALIMKRVLAFHFSLAVLFLNIHIVIFAVNYNCTTFA